MNDRKHTYFQQFQYWFSVLFFMLTAAGVSAAEKPAKNLNTRFFTENKGQWDHRFLYKAELGSGAMYLEKNAFQYFFFNADQFAVATRHPDNFWTHMNPPHIDGFALKARFLGANEEPGYAGTEALPFYYNYFKGNEPEHWATEVRSYRKVSLYGLYPGTDLHLYSDPASGAMKYDLELAAGADPNLIRLEYEGALDVELKKGSLYIQTSLTTVVEKKPFAYQWINQQQVKVDCRFVLSENKHISFAVGEYDRSLPLIIDPVLVFSTYSGSTADNFGATATYDSEGNLYSAGITESISTGRYPTTQGAVQYFASGGTLADWPQSGFECDITISKYNNDGSQLLYATYLGGTRNDYVHSLVVDNYDQLIVFGTTVSRNFPVTLNAYDNTHNDSFDIILTKFSKTGTYLVGSTYFGGSHSDGISLADTLCIGYMDQMRGEVIVDKNNDVIVGTVTNSIDFPTSPTALQTAIKGKQDGCVFKMDSSLGIMRWSTYLGDTFQETLTSVDVDASGNIYAVGGTFSKNIPIVGPVWDSSYHGGISDAYIARLSSDGSTLQRFKYWGSISYDQSFFVKVHTNGDVYMMGQNFDTVPVTPGVYSNTKGSINICAFSRGLDTLRFATRIGNQANKNILSPSAFMVDFCGNVYGAVWAGPINISNGLQTGGWLIRPCASTTVNLQVTPDAIQPTTDNKDFYLFQLGPGLVGLQYATFVGEHDTRPGFGEDHVDGGTSRFDHRGIIYQSFCASCASGPSGTFPTTDSSFAPKNVSTRCSNASMKLDFRNNNLVIADFNVSPRRSCTDSIVKFINNSYHGVRFRWYLNGVLKDSTYHYQDTFRTKGFNTIKLVVVDSPRCNIIDSITKVFEIQNSVHADFEYTRDTCSAAVFFRNKSASQNGDPMSYFWSFGDGDTSTQINPTHIFPKNGPYTVTLYTNPSSFCYDTAKTLLQYDSTSHILRASMNPFDTTGCEPAQIHITNTSYNGKQFQWYVNNTLATTLKNFDSVMSKGDYDIKLVVTDPLTCLKKDSVKQRIHVVPDVLPNFSIIRDSCSYTLKLVNNTVIPPGDSVKMVWFFGDGDTSVEYSPVHTYPSPGTYRIQLFTNPRLLCVRQMDVMYLIDNNKNVLQAKFTPKPAMGCKPATVKFENSSTNGVKFRWYINSILTDSTTHLTRTFDSAGLYHIRLIAIDSASCHKSDTFETDYQVYPFQETAFSFKRDSCSADVIFTNLSDTTNNGVVPFTWYFGDGDSSNAFNTIHVYPKNGTYPVKLISNKFTTCADTASVLVNYDSLSHQLKVQFDLSDSILCLPAYIKATNTSIGSKSNKWYLNDTYRNNTFDLTDTLLTTGNYTLKLVGLNPTGCTTADSMTRQISVSAASHVAFELARDSCSLLVKFQNNSTSSSSAPVWVWHFGDGDTSTERNPTHKYKETGVYTIRLVSDPGTVCSDTMEQTWLVDGDTIQELFIPNVFTPDDDQFNDCFTVKGVSPKCDQYHIWIRNRWGNLFFESTDPTICWNGRNEAGSPASPGVYFYVIKIRKQSGLFIDKAGTVTLIRLPE